VRELGDASLTQRRLRELRSLNKRQNGGREAVTRPVLPLDCVQPDTYKRRAVLLPVTYTFKVLVVC